jgi:hypothetical protein
MMSKKPDLSLAGKAKKYGVSLGTLKKVFRRGVAAWNSGHRPGTTPQQWGHARVNSYLRKGKTYHTADKDLHEETKITGTNCGNCIWWNKKSEQPVDKFELNENGGLKAPNEAYITMSKHVDLVTLAGKASVDKKALCGHEEIQDFVTERMCCAYWDGKGVKREFKGTADAMKEDINQLFEMQLMGTDGYRQHAIAMTPGQNQEIEDAFPTEEYGIDASSNESEAQQAPEYDGKGSNAKTGYGNPSHIGVAFRDLRKALQEQENADAEEEVDDEGGLENDENEGDGVDFTPSLKTKKAKNYFGQQYVAPDISGLPVLGMANEEAQMSESIWAKLGAALGAGGAAQKTKSGHKLGAAIDALKSGSEVGLHALHGAKNVGTVGKFLAKRAPGIGLGLGLAGAADRAAHGDYVGAGIEGLGGVASTLPGVGTAISAGLEGVNLARDITGASHGGEHEPAVASVQKPVMKPIAKKPMLAKTPAKSTKLLAANITKKPVKLGEETLNEAIEYHKENKISFVENVYRPGSEMFFAMILEAKNLYAAGEYTPKDEFEQDLLESNIGEIAEYEGETVLLDYPYPEELNEEGDPTKGKGIGKPFRSGGGGAVYVRNGKGNIIKVNFSQSGMKKRYNEPGRVRSFIARHHCLTNKDRTSASYWACRWPRYFSDSGQRWW